MKDKELISIISPCYNEEDNVEEIYKKVLNQIEKYEEFNFEYLFIDNASTDKTVEILRNIANKDKRVKIIINTRNFGHIRSPYWGIMQTKGVATIYLASDLQDPPELIGDFISNWKAGYKIVLAVKPTTKSNSFFHFLRETYYKFLNKISDVSIIKNATGFGLYDKVVLDEIRKIQDPYPFLRGLICELGFKIKIISFEQPARLKGLSKNNLYSLIDIGLLGIVSHSIVPIRLASIIGFILGSLSIFFALSIFILKLIFWEEVPIGYAPFGILLLLIFGTLLFFIGIVGEYVAVILSYVRNRPIVIEEERINFEFEDQKT